MNTSLMIGPLAALLLISCGRQSHVDSIIPEDAFIRVYADMLIVNGQERMTNADTSHNRRMIDSVFRSHGVSRGDMGVTIDYYNNHLDRWKDVLDKVDARLQTLQVERSSKIKN
jgi:hypothetical protein